MFKVLYYISLFLVYEKSFSQEFESIKQKTDSIWANKIRAKTRKFKSEYDTIKYTVSYSKATNEIMYIEEKHQSRSYHTIWIYRYHFRTGNLILLSRWNNTSINDPKRKCALYYFENNILKLKDELRTNIPDIEAELIKAKALFTKFSN